MYSTDQITRACTHSLRWKVVLKAAVVILALSGFMLAFCVCMCVCVCVCICVCVYLCVCRCTCMGGWDEETEFNEIVRSCQATLTGERTFFFVYMLTTAAVASRIMAVTMWTSMIAGSFQRVVKFLMLWLEKDLWGTFIMVSPVWLERVVRL